MKKMLFASAMLAMTMGGPAYAADMAAAPAMSTYNWSGFYAGVQAGYAWGDATAPYGFVSGGPYPAFQAAAKQKGFIGGVHAGYDYQLDSIVFGVEGDVEYSNVKGDDGGSGGHVNGLDDKWQGSLRGRLGYAFDNVLVYGTGGVAFMHATATAPGYTDGVGFTGWTAGAGAQYALTPQLSVRAEYRYTDFGKSEAAFPAYGYYENYNPKQNAVRIGLSYRF